MSATDNDRALEEKNRAIKTLMAKQDEFQTLTDLLEEIIFRCDDSGRLTLLNAAWSRITGWPADECIGRHFAEFIDDAETLTALSQHHNEREAVVTEIRIITRHNDEKTFTLHAQRRDKAWYGSLHEVTALHLATSALEESREQARKLALVASRTDNLVIISDADGQIEWVNQSFVNNTGYCLAEVRGKTPGSFLQGPQTDIKTIAQMREGLAQGKGFNVEIVNFRKNGEPYWLAIDCSPVHNENGQIVNFIAVEREITERKQAEQTLRDSEQHYRNILNTISEPIFYCDASLQIHFANPAWQTLTGPEFSNTSPHQLTEFIHPDDIFQLNQARDNICAGLPPSRQELRLRDSRDNWRRVELLLSSNGHSTSKHQQHLTGALFDVDERWQHTQAILQSKADAEELSKSRTQFVANMSHEIRTPLNAILGMGSVLQETDLNPEQREYLDTLCNGGKALLALVNDVLDLSKLDSQEIQLESIEFKLDELCEEAVDIVAARIEEKNLTLAMHCSPDVPQVFIGDPHRIRQLLINLLGNAVKFTSRGGITLQLDWQALDKGHGHLSLIISDTGIGIPQDRISSLFNAFIQADTSTTRRYGGTGLGLAICQQICTAMGGNINIASVVGKGSTFRCDLPFRCTAANTPTGNIRLSGINLDERTARVGRSLACRMGYRFHTEQTNLAGSSLSLMVDDGNILTLNSPQTSAVLTPNRLLRKLQALDKKSAQVTLPRTDRGESSLRILIAEDSIPNQMVVEAMLKQLGYKKVSIVSNGKLALEAASEKEFDLILLDIHMPVMDGLTAAQAIREKLQEATPMIVAASADVTTDARKEASEAGFDDWLPKPFTRELLQALLEKASAHLLTSQTS
jgi:PAS domain S-box-containing protein